MKKLFLLTLAAASTASMFAQDYTNSINDKFRPGVSLSVEWANLDVVASAADLRIGNGANDKFYLNNYKANTVEIYNELGLEKALTVPSDYLWVCNNVDDAGNVVVRGSNEVWPGTGAYAGCFYPDKAGNLIFIIDGKTDEFVPGVKYNMTDGPQGRWDAFGHVSYDVLAPGYWQILASNDAGTTGSITDFIFDGETGEFSGAESAAGKHHEAFTGASKKHTTLGSAMYYGEADADGFYATAAVYGNPYAGLTGSNAAADLANGVQRYDYLADEDEVMKWTSSGEYFITPQHSDIGGFMVFTLGAKQYIVYPGGNSTTHAGDAIAIAEVAFTDSPVGDATLDVQNLVARSYGAATDTGSPKYFAGSMHQCLNVEPVEGDPTSVYIYCYAQKCPMVKFKFTDASADGAGIDNVTVDNNADAPAEYYNVAGVRVAHPTAGNIYIRKQGTSVAKVVY